MKKIELKEIVQIIKSGRTGILPTDTIYGIVGSAMNEKTVEKIYKLRKRNKTKPMIILISSKKDLDLFGIRLSEKQEKVLKKFWPGKVSVILDCKKKKFEYLHRGKNSLAFRLPKEKWLQNFLKKTGPLVAPSANFEGEKPALAIAEAKEYFSDKVDFYVDFGKMESKPSMIIRLLKKGEVEVLRK